MRSRTTIKPTDGTDAHTNWLQQVVARLMEELNFYDSTTVKWKQTPRGLTAHATANVSPSGTKGWFWIAGKRKYDKTQSYAKDQAVYVPTTDPLINSGTLDPDSGQMVFATAGIWIALKPVAPVPGPAYRIPHLPYPVPDDPDAPTNYWWFISAAEQCM